MIEIGIPRTAILGTAAITILIGTLLSAFYPQSVKAEGTIYIKSDGSVDPPIAFIQRNGDIYTLRGNVSASIEVQRNNTIIDGNGCTLQGNGTDRAIVSRNTNNVTIKNAKIKSYSAGISVDHSIYNRIINNLVTNCTYGILPDYSPSTTVVNNTITNNKWDGIFAVSSPNSVIINNTVTNQGKWGLYLGACEGSTLRRNFIKGNRYNFAVSSEFVLDVDTSNTVDNKPIYYWINQRNRQVPLDAGYVAAVNSVNVVIRNLDLKNNGQGVVLANSANSIIENLNVTENGYFGIYLLNSNFNTIRNNFIASDSWGGVALISSTGNTVSNNSIFRLDKSVLLHESDGNTINNNTLKDNNEGPYLSQSSGNTIINNLIENNDVGIYLYDSSNDNVIHHNNFVNNTQQVHIKDSRSSWDNGYPSGGNFWSDYHYADDNSDGICDTPYVLDNANRDNYPFMNLIQEVWSQPQTKLDYTTIVFQIVAVTLVGVIVAYFLKNIRSERTGKFQ